MFSTQNKLFHSRWLIWQTTALTIFLLLLAWPLSPAHTQGSFNSGSTGADGAFNPTTSQQIQLPASGVFNYTTVNIPPGVDITYKRNAANTPVTILATGNVVINGTISIVGGGANSYLAGGAGGPGGFDGGRGASGIGNDLNGFNGDGPGSGGGGRSISGVGYGEGGGGGYARAGQSGRQSGGQGGGTGGTAYGSPTLIPLIGGSGGGGSASPSSGSRGSSGGGGGGAILIASSGSISGSINAYINAGGGGASCPPFNSAACGGGGSGGGIRLVANTISGNLGLYVSSGGGYASGFGNGGAGYIRVEAYDLTNFNPGISPSDANFTISTPKAAIPSNLPSLRIASVAGINAPTNPVGSFNGVTDITVPTTQTNPVTVALSASNIPTGTIVTVKVTPENGTATTVQSTGLAGTQASSTATASVTLPTGVCLISATTTVDLLIASNLKPLFIDGERVRKMEISATFGGQSEITYITESGKRIKRVSE